MPRKLTDQVQLKLRFDEKLRRRLQREAERSTRSMNGEIIHRLEQSFARDDEFGGAHNVALFRQIAGAIGLAEAKEGERWVENHRVAHTVLSAVFDVFKREIPGLRMITFETKNETETPGYYKVGIDGPPASAFPDPEQGDKS